MWFEIYPDVEKKWRWRLRTGRNVDDIIADSGQGYDRKRDCEHAIQLVQQSTHAQVRQVDE